MLLSSCKPNLLWLHVHISSSSLLIRVVRIQLIQVIKTWIIQYNRHHCMFADQEYVSSLPLQMALYFNLFYFPFWIVSEIVMLVAKVKWQCGSQHILLWYLTFYSFIMLRLSALVASSISLILKSVGQMPGCKSLFVLEVWSSI